MRIATYNVNSIKQRVEPMQAWLKERAPDIVCLQEIKCVDEAFPRGAFEDLGYNVAVIGFLPVNGNVVAQILEGTARKGFVCLQEIKCVDEAFPRGAFEDLGYNVAVHGQKTYNGVAILSKFPLDEVAPQLPGDGTDVHARYLEAVVSTGDGALRVASIYLPNGNPPGGEKYEYK